ncbi:MAG: DUF4112 domain-containing protein [Acidobacteria bacterium]|nr:DUF4112 domain-containing protein [Acidobacteriota bacterium]
MRELAKEQLEPRRKGSVERRKVEIEESLDQISRWMDGLFRIPGVGWRFGLDALVGLIPGVGDTATTLVSFYILAAGVRYRVPKVTLLRMGLNIAIDYLLGSVPVVGDVFDAIWKANQMNVELLKERATVSAEEARSGKISDWLFVAVIILILLVLLFGSIALSIYLLTLLVKYLSS